MKLKHVCLWDFGQIITIILTYGCKYHGCVFIICTLLRGLSTWTKPRGQVEVLQSILLRPTIHLCQTLFATGEGAWWLSALSLFLEELDFKSQRSQSSYVSKAIPEIMGCLSTEILGLHPCQKEAYFALLCCFSSV